MISPAVHAAALALARLLEGAAADGFAGLVRDVGRAGLGAALRAASDRLIALGAGPDVAAVVGWRALLDGFDALPRHRQAAEVAHGLELVEALTRAPVAPVAPPTPVAPVAPPTPAAPVAPVAPPPAALVLVAPAPAPAKAARPRAVRAAPGPASLPADPLGAPLTTVKGIGPALAAALAEKGLTTVEDLLWLVPRRWLDARELVELEAALVDVHDGDRVAARAVVKSARMVRVRGRSWGEVRFGSAPRVAPQLTVRWFNIRGGVEQRFPPGAEVALSGVLKRRGTAWEMANPDVLGIRPPGGDGGDVGAAATILPRYPDVPGVPAGRLRAACQAAVTLALAAATVVDGVPDAVAARMGLSPLDRALAALHAPALDSSAEEIAALNAGASVHHRRLAFAELFTLGALIVARRRARQADRATPLPPAAGLLAELATALPFALTAAQRRAVAELGADLARPVPMNRLLQGDVGAGKTAVAFAAALHTIRAGAQVALMAPTELLAEQHHATFARWARPLGVRVALLTASTPRAERQVAQARLAAGELDLVVGTHALLGEAVGFARLGLAVIDEQHRFGVAQRVGLRQKSAGAAGAPHLLVMTATPIPRTLCLTAYGDLDSTIIDELPPGRVPPLTAVHVGAAGRAAAYQQLVARVQAGERGFVVCPLVDASDDDSRAGWADVTAVSAELTRTLAPLRVGVVHGQLGAAARDAAMGAFARGDLDVLVATTVIEVGVDVPAATVMLIEDADRFGLAQLHQLRGRIGRGAGASWCLLLTRGGASDDGQRRLEVIAGTTDGFRIAEEDLALRGPGELLGARQAGLPRLRYGDVATHTALLLAARAEAERVLDEDPDLARPEHAGLRRVLARKLAVALAFGSDSG